MKRPKPNKAKHTLVQRKEAVEAALAKFDMAALEWGRFDCAKLALFVAREMGHRVGVSSFGQYKTPAGARAALARNDFTDLPELVDALGFERIAPAACLPGDLIGFLPEPDPENPLPGDDLTALAVYVGNGRILGFHAASGVCQVLRPDLSRAAVPPIAWRL